ncbi:DNA (cytosine-5)-methyltransferase CMT3 [Rutidosis leptorrhynchoides]|uniref:DNA (cytosine-5)-methyltransferase CMT3 n=1 Tax=Rutidosis leptorrhynchoides TaxID=125765 RepID=UPI003A990C09
MPAKKRSSKKSSASSSNKKQKLKIEDLTNEAAAIAVDVEAPVKSEEQKVESSVKSEDKTVESPVKSEEEKVEVDDGEESRFTGDPVSDDEARRRWPHRYLSKEEINKMDPSKVLIQAKRHYTEALVDGRVHFRLGDDGYVFAGAGNNVEHYICRVVEMFEGVDSQLYFYAQWFYRAKDTVIKNLFHLVDDRRIFLSEVKDDNPLDCLLEKLKLVRVPIEADVATKRALLGNGDYYYDMLYLVPFSSYQVLPPDDVADGNESDSTISSDTETNALVADVSKFEKGEKSEMRMLDLYSGCGAMSTGICLGVNMAGLNLVTKWAVDFNKYACESLKHNHPETEVRNETAEDFLQLLKEWQRLCQLFSIIEGGDPSIAETNDTEVGIDDEEDDEEDDNLDEEVFEVDQILAICYGDPKGIHQAGLYFKIRWKNYGPEEDTWEPSDSLGDCKEKIKQFVMDGYNSKMLPLPGDVDVICGGPPCQGISGFNRFRNTEKPLDDEKNKQLLVYMDIVDHLKPRFALMENVVDIVKFSNGYLGRYALGRLISMNYQVRMGLMTAGGYGLPQFRTRMFMWAARPNEKLPQYPLPTHKVVTRGVFPKEFESNVVVDDDLKGGELKDELFLGHAISDLPPVTNYEEKDEMPYVDPPQTEFQKFIRLKKKDMPGSSNVCDDFEHPLYDHRPYKCNIDDYQRICQIPKRKDANFRDLKGVRVRADNTVEFDPDIPRQLLESGKPLVPDYCMTYVDGKSTKPFGRMWWDEIVPTVVTRAEPHNQAILHPVQDRVLSVRENARLQGFPDYYKLIGPIKERYMQVGNAVAVPVARALGYSLAMSCKGTTTEGPIFSLPKNFPNLEVVTPASPPLVEEDQ